MSVPGGRQVLTERPPQSPGEKPRPLPRSSSLKSSEKLLSGLQPTMVRPISLYVDDDEYPPVPPRRTTSLERLRVIDFAGGEQLKPHPKPKVPEKPKVTSPEKPKVTTSPEKQKTVPQEKPKVSPLEKSKVAPHEKQKIVSPEKPKVVPTPEKPKGVGQEKPKQNALDTIIPISPDKPRMETVSDKPKTISADRQKVVPNGKPVTVPDNPIISIPDKPRQVIQEKPKIIIRPKELGPAVKPSSRPIVRVDNVRTDAKTKHLESGAKIENKPVTDMKPKPADKPDKPTKPDRLKPLGGVKVLPMLPLPSNDVSADSQSHSPGQDHLKEKPRDLKPSDKPPDKMKKVNPLDTILPAPLKLPASSRQRPSLVKQKGDVLPHEIPGHFYKNSDATAPTYVPFCRVDETSSSNQSTLQKPTVITAQATIEHQEPSKRDGDILVGGAIYRARLPTPPPSPPPPLRVSLSSTNSNEETTGSSTPPPAPPPVDYLQNSNGNAHRYNVV